MADMPVVAHQFDDAVQQRETAELGMWVFLCTEIMMFGGMFTGYGVYRVRYEEAFAAASHHMDLFWGTVNTGVLLVSSLLMALAVQAAQAGLKKRLIGLLSGTIVLGATFLGIKFYEYYQHYLHHKMPIFGLPFEFEEASPQQAQLFFDFYFVMTGVHATHMIIGLGILLTLVVLASRGGLLGERSTPVHISGLYWHFVDIVWVFLYPFLYLVGAHL